MIAIRPLRLASTLIVGVAFATLASLGSGVNASVAEPNLDSRLQNEHLALAISLIESVFNDRDPSVVDRLVADDVRIDTSSGTFIGPDGLLEYAENIRRLYPDAWFQITSLIVSDGTVEVGWTMSATRIEMDTTGRIYDMPVELTGKFTLTVGGGQVEHMSAVSEELVVAGPSGDVAALPPELPFRGEPA